ncbi:hypothetical protein OHB14_51230 [Streptomyces sp. NBC_01613]|uniref:hypothetical protein n=1 Tax=Streptomyces sp. NBC_01613 TaxID=2975896 RepID=UPI00386A66A1
MLHHLDSTSKDALFAEVRRVLRPDGLLVLVDAVLDEHGHDHWQGRGRWQVRMRGRMREQLRDNVADAVSQRIATAGFTMERTRTFALRIGGRAGIELAHPSGAGQK